MLNDNSVKKIGLFLQIFIFFFIVTEVKKEIAGCIYLAPSINLKVEKNVFVSLEQCLYFNSLPAG